MSHFTLHDLTIKKFRDGLVNKEFKALEAVEAFFNYIEDRNKEIGAYLSLSKDLAFKQAEAADLAIASGSAPDALCDLIGGVPLALKDNILVEGEITTAGSKILKDYIAAYDATAVRKLRKAGAVFLGKTNLDEFAMGSSTENSAFGVTKNPHDLERVPGGSSGGSAAAVAANMTLGALGSDTGGSIREPAAFCGVVGLKPTYGAVSRFGLISMASSLDQIGTLTKTVEDAAILFKAIAGPDNFDSTSSNPPDGAYGAEILNSDFEGIKKMTIGLPSEYFSLDGIEPEVMKGVQDAIQTLKSLGIKFKEISLPHTKYALSCYYIIMPAEVSANLSRFDGIRYGRHVTGDKGRLLDIYLKTKTEGFGLEAKRRILLGTFVLSSGYYEAYYSKAQKVRSLIKNDFRDAFKEVDVILAPVSPTRAFKIGEKSDDPLTMYLSDIFTIPVNLAGLPAISIPVKSNDQSSKNKLPVGFQLIGKPWREADILNIGKFYEKI